MSRKVRNMIQKSQGKINYLAAAEPKAAAQEEVLIKSDEKIGNSRRFARYLPFWA